MHAASAPAIILEDADAQNLLDRQDVEIKKVVDGEITFQIPGAEPTDVVPHLESLEPLALTQSSDCPELLLYKLGSFQNDMDLQTRTQPFLGHNHKIFVDSTGSGKTRLMIETLCFTADVPTNKADPSFLRNNELSMSLSFHPSAYFYQFLRHIPPALEEQCKSISAYIPELLSSEDNHLLIVINEAQIASELRAPALLSPYSTATVHRPLLRQIVEWWYHALGRLCSSLSYH
ncbi:hypothetical protein DFS33DRAFT_1385853 [Desarmillaria ectypa]|nr:hypothetical protein DFS33DRAFT_1385853 [Desarmillaria ectypa]